MAQRLLVDQKVPISVASFRTSLIHDAREPCPRGRVFASHAQVAAEHSLDGFEVAAGLRAAGALQQGGRITPDLQRMQPVHRSAHDGNGRHQDRQESQVESSHRLDPRSEFKGGEDSRTGLIQTGSRVRDMT